MKAILLIAAVLGPLFWSNAWAAGPAAPVEAPIWWDHAKTEDAEYYFSKGSSVECKSEQEAREMAFQNAKRMLGLWLSTNTVGRLKTSEPLLTAGGLPIELIGLNSHLEAVANANGKFVAWMLVSYPKKLFKEDLARARSGGLGNEPRLGVLVCPFAFDTATVDQFPEVVGAYKRQGYGLGIWQTVANGLFNTPYFKVVSWPYYSVTNILDSIDRGAPPPKDTPPFVLISNMNFATNLIQTVSWGRLVTRQTCHAHLTLDLKSRDLNWETIASGKGSARGTDKIAAMESAATNAFAGLVQSWTASRHRAETQAFSK